MKKTQIITLLLVGFAIWISCKSTQTADETSFGTGVANPESAISFADVSKQLDSSDSLKVVLKAKVTEVCQAKGCWMNVADPMSKSEDVLFVQFQDYGFFMPKDLAGKEVVMEGIAYKQETSVDELRHYAEDAGKNEDEIAGITEPVMEKKFMATGVVILK